MSKEIRSSKALFKGQLILLGFLGLAGLGLLIANFFFPNFFKYTYLKWGGWSSVGKFWPLFLWGGLMALISSAQRAPLSRIQKRELLRHGLKTSLMAGIWEELAYRWIFIFYAMVGLMFTNFIYGTFVGWILLIICGLATFTAFGQGKVLAAVVFGVCTAIMAWFLMYVNPVYWIYENLIVPLVHLVTFHQIGSVLYGGYDQLFIFGAIVANAWFRDGHKYQGPIGIINSWYIGLILLYATLTYGLWTAVAIHALYDVEFDVARYLFGRVRRPSMEDELEFILLN